MVASRNVRITWTRDESEKVAAAMWESLVRDPKLSLIGAVAVAQCSALPAHRQRPGIDRRYLTALEPLLIRRASAERAAGRRVPEVIAELLPPPPAAARGPDDRIDRLHDRVDRLDGVALRLAEDHGRVWAKVKSQETIRDEVGTLKAVAANLAAQLREECDDNRRLRERMDRLEQDLKAAVGLIEELADRGPAPRPAAAARPSGQGQEARAGNGRVAVKLPTFWVPGARSETLQRLALHFKGRAVIDGPGTNDNRRATYRVRSADYYVLPLKWCGSEVWQAVKEYLGEQYPAAEQAGRVMVLDPRAGGDTVIQEAIENALAVNGRA